MISLEASHHGHERTTMDRMPHYQPTVVELDDKELDHTSFSKPVIFFYGGVFGNFTSSPIKIGFNHPWLTTFPHPREYATVEHFYQASKAASEYYHEKIRLAETAALAKRLGNQRQSLEPGRADAALMRPDWEDIKIEVMLTGCRVKFRTISVLRAALLDTGDCIIAEDSPTDFIWGVRDGNGGFTGQNLLGKALMQVRDELRKEEAP